MRERHVVLELICMSHFDTDVVVCMCLVYALRPTALLDSHQNRKSVPLNSVTLHMNESIAVSSPLLGNLSTE